MKSRALFFGLNYAHEPDAALNGCINDVHNMAEYLKSQYSDMLCEIYTDDVDRVSTSAQGIVSKLYELAIKSYSESLSFVYIHYSGHGSYVRDCNRDERDGKDECLVPSDFKTAGLVVDDILQSLFRNFNSATRVVFVCDSCHSGSMGDVKYCWESPNIVTVENILCAVKAKLITLSGCMDMQTSADAFNISGDNKYTGALTSCLLMTLRETPTIKSDVFAILKIVRNKLAERRFAQIPKLCSSYNLTKDLSFFP